MPQSISTFHLCDLHCLSLAQPRHHRLDFRLCLALLASYYLPTNGLKQSIAITSSY